MDSIHQWSAPLQGRGGRGWGRWFGIMTGAAGGTCVAGGADVTGDIQVADLLPAWLYLVLAAGAANAAWVVEGRRRRG